MSPVRHLRFWLIALAVTLLSVYLLRQILLPLDRKSVV